MTNELKNLIENSVSHQIVRLLYWCERMEDYSCESMLKFFRICTNNK